MTHLKDVKMIEQPHVKKNKQTNKSKQPRKNEGESLLV